MKKATKWMIPHGGKAAPHAGLRPERAFLGVIQRGFRYTYGSWGRNRPHPEHRTQEDALAAQKERMRERRNGIAGPLWTQGTMKQPATWLHMLKEGQTYRLVDDHGKEYGKRRVAGPAMRYDDAGARTQVRRCKPQPESLMSELTRLRNREHRMILRGAPGTGFEGA